MTIWGIGKGLIVYGLSASALAFALIYAFPQVFIIQALGCRPLRGTGCLLLGIGLVWLAASVWTLFVHTRRGALASEGLYACTRNPLYFAWIVLIIPGISFFLCTWGLLPVSFLMYFVFEKYIPREETSLQRQFGADYEAYAARTPRFWPRACFSRAFFGRK